MVIWSKNQGINIVAPYCWIFPPVQLMLSGCGPVQSYRLGSALRKGAEMPVAAQRPFCHAGMPRLAGPRNCLGGQFS